MSWANVAIAGVAVIGSLSESQANKEATEAQTRGSRNSIAALRSGEAGFNERTQPFADIGLSAAPALAQLLGLDFVDPNISRLQSKLAEIEARIAEGPPAKAKKRRSRGGKFGSLLGGFIGEIAPSVRIGGEDIDPSFFSAAANIGEQIDKGFDPDIPSDFSLEELEATRTELTSRLQTAQAAAPTNPLQTLGAQTQIEEINPILSFLRDEGFEDIQNTAAARGSLGSGGTLEDLTRFNTQLASTVVPQLQQQRFNQLFNILGLGANAATGQGQAGLQTAGNVGNLLSNIGNVQAQGALNEGRNQQQLISNLAGAFGSFRGSQQPGTGISDPGRGSLIPDTGVPQGRRRQQPNIDPRFEAFS